VRNFEEIEAYFKRKIKLLGDLAEPIEVEMIMHLLDQVKSLEAENEKLAALNRHYFFKFYGGNLEVMKKDCSYLFNQ
jgi:hypothetical protein